MIEMKSCIDNPKKINRLLQIHGDKERYFSYLVNFISNSIKRSDIGGTITVEIAVMEQQQNYDKSEGSQIHQLGEEMCIKLRISITDQGKNDVKPVLIDIRDFQIGNHQKEDIGIVVSKSFIELTGGSVRLFTNEDKGTTYSMTMTTKCRLTDIEWHPNNKLNYFIIKFGPSTDIQAQVDWLKDPVEEEAKDHRPNDSEDDDDINFERCAQQNLILGGGSHLQKNKSTEAKNQQLKELEELLAKSQQINMRQLSGQVLAVSQHNSSISNISNILKRDQGNEEEEKKNIEELKMDGIDNIEQSHEGIKMRVLIVNRDQSQLECLTFTFRLWNFEVVTGINGTEALSTLKQTIGAVDGLFDLVVLDLNMPIQDGYETCKRILELYIPKSEENVKLHVYKPIMIACQQQEITDYDIAQAHKFGFDQVVSAPIDFNIFKEQIKPALDIRASYILSEIAHCQNQINLANI